MYVVSSCKGRDLTLQGGVIYVTIVLQSSFFCLETKERSKEKFKADFFLLLASEKKVGRETMRGAGHCDRMYDGGGMVVMMCFPQHSCCGKDLMLAVSFV